MQHKFEVNGEIFTFNSSEQDAKIIESVIEDFLTKSGFVNIDSDDIRSIIDGADKVKASKSIASGENKIEDAAIEAVKEIHNAKKMLVSFTTDVEATLIELSEGAMAISEAVTSDAELIWGHVIDDEIGDKCIVRIIASI